MSEHHIASFIVRCRRKYLSAIVSDIQHMQGAEIHEQDPMGKITVTVKGDTHTVISNIAEQVRNMAHVVDVAAVYHKYVPHSKDGKG
ncbi:chaperone NapD [uncultured Paraglaciecola sp.]|uniref:chaperone NapD n=1 Tax=uncultured Paraglaciecola sp. TaxID=1765024 RepID=UPI002599A6CE|nr:chaperone NapD [uncultured Paraglaciecola sp.]